MPQSEAQILAAKARMVANGVWDQALTYGDAFYLKAIPPRESDGILSRQGPKYTGYNYGAQCAYMIGWTNIVPTKKNKGWAAEAGMTPEAFRVKLLSDPAFCTKYGNRALQEGKSGRGSLIGGLCQYAGEVTQYGDLGWCWGSVEYTVIAETMGTSAGSAGVVTRTTNVDTASEDYTLTTVKNSKGEVIAEYFECADRTGELSKALAKAAETYRVTRTRTQEKIYHTSVKEKLYNPIHLGDIAEEQKCLNYYVEKQGFLRDKMDVKSLFKRAIQDLVDDFLNQTCGYFSDTMQTLVNNALNTMCLPLSLDRERFDLGVDLANPDLGTTTCDGLNLLGNYAIFNSTTTTTPSVDVYSLGSVPVVVGIPSYSITPIGPDGFIRRGELNEDGTYEFQ
ncbi:MAG: hypothetical protein AB7E52_04645 [Bdellovibrionales bacterium]